MAEIPAEVAAELARLRAENAQLLRLLKMTPQQAAEPGPGQAGFFEATGPELAAELAARGLASPMSASSVRRILAEHPVKPWQYPVVDLPPRPGLRGQGEGHR